MFNISVRFIQFIKCYVSPAKLRVTVITMTCRWHHSPSSFNVLRLSIIQSISVDNIDHTSLPMVITCWQGHTDCPPILWQIISGARVLTIIVSLHSRFHWTRWVTTSCHGNRCSPRWQITTSCCTTVRPQAGRSGRCRSRAIRYWPPGKSLYTITSTVKPILRDHCHDRPLVWKTTHCRHCRQVVQFTIIAPVMKPHLFWETTFSWPMGSFKAGSTVHHYWPQTLSLCWRLFGKNNLLRQKDKIKKIMVLVNFVNMAILTFTNLLQGNVLSDATYLLGLIPCI